ncbi:MAG: CotH kinase family protein, partial [Nitrospira sp.]|nr:CotH kinase family protein [Nitrospira sp.]
ETVGLLYDGPIPIQRSTILRAAAFLTNHRPSNVDTHTYLFARDVLGQPAAPAGFPTSWAGIAADYAMDPRITQSATYGSLTTNALRHLPTLSVVTDTDNLFGGSRGIYANPERNGVAWERPVSLEWITPEGDGAFQIDCGLRIQGGYFRNRSVTQKHSLRLLFKDEYGPGRLKHDLFHEFGAARDFDTLVLRAGANDGYSWDAARDTEQFLRDEFGRRLYLDMGQPSARGRFVHLYLNGLYWGLYNLTERPAEDFSATYLGGNPEDWDAINSGEVKNGSLDAWNALITRVRSATSLTDYQRLKGLNPDGSPNPAFTNYLDAPNYIDYMVLNVWGGNWDWPNKNFWFGRHRGGLAGGFKFYLWDFENTMGNNRDRSPLSMVAPRSDIASSWVGEPHQRLKSLPEYRIEFADRVQKHFFGQGVLAPSALVERYRALAHDLEPAIVAESARWGDDHWSPPQDLADWQRERDWLLNTYLPQRTAIVLDQFRRQGLYPSVAAPTL